VCGACVDVHTPIFTLRNRQFLCGSELYGMRRRRVITGDERGVMTGESGTSASTVHFGPAFAPGSAICERKRGGGRDTASELDYGCT